MDTNILYYGDNLDILRSDYIPAESVDLIYLDPPFNSNRDYNVIFKDESGQSSDAQLHAFDDIWHWGPTAAAHYDYLTNTAIGSIPTEVEGARRWVKADPDNRFEFQYLCIALIEAVPVGGKSKKGADSGIDGLITFTDAKGKVRKVIVSVKSGKVGVKDIRDLVGAMARESAPLGVYITLEAPTAPMKTEAASAGTWWRPKIAGGGVPRSLEK